MKKTPVFAAVLLAALTAVLCCLPAAGAPDETPAVSIDFFALSHENAVYIEYGVDCTGFEPTKSNIGMLYWTEEPSDPTYENAESRSPALGYSRIDSPDNKNENKNYYIFKYDKLTARQMCDTVWARAYAVLDGVYYYSDLEAYSVVTYASHKLGLTDGIDGTQDGELTEMLIAMLKYGASMQQLFHYRTDTLATDILPDSRHTVRFDSAGGSMVPDRSVFDGRPLSAPADPVWEGHRFLGWYCGGKLWNFSSDRVTSDITLTAKWRAESET